MNTKLLFIPLMITFLFIPVGCKNNQEVKTVEIKGVKHIQNPDNPIKGIIRLEVEKVLEIDPYQYEGVGLNSLSFKRGNDETVIIYDT